VDPRIRKEHVEDGERIGRPKEISPEVEQAIIEAVTKNRCGREKSTEILAFDSGISYISVWRILRKHGFKVVKPSWKPGLTEAAKQARYAFAKRFAHWTLEDWKRVIWTDETSVILGHRRGAIRVWRTIEDAHDSTCVRRRWKKASEFMFWGSFSYDKKGPCHIFSTETAKDKKKTEQDLAQLNSERESLCRTKWELETAMEKLNILRNPPDRKPRWN
jgi:hypothetical protein